MSDDRFAAMLARAAVKLRQVTRQHSESDLPVTAAPKACVTLAILYGRHVGLQADVVVISVFGSASDDSADRLMNEALSIGLVQHNFLYLRFKTCHASSVIHEFFYKCGFSVFIRQMLQVFCSALVKNTQTWPPSCVAERKCCQKSIQRRRRVEISIFSCFGAILQISFAQGDVLDQK
jgi:hypothetical protein